MSNQIHQKSRMFDFLVKVSENSLQINENALKQLNTMDHDSNHKVIVLSVIGQPKSRKTSLMNYILHMLSREENLLPEYLLPLRSDDEDLKYEEGILIYNPITRRRNDVPYIWLLLDIWMPNPRKMVYKKLVDFCLNMSSTVIFSEPCDQGSPPIYWSPELSKFPQLSKSIQNSLQLHFLIGTDDEGTSIQCYPEGSPLDHHCNHLLSPKLDTVIKTHLFFKVRCLFTTSSYISRATSENYQFETIRQILLNSMYNSLKINDEVINITHVDEWFEKCVNAVNKLFSLYASDDQTEWPKVEKKPAHQQKQIGLFDPVDSTTHDHSLLVKAYDEYLSIFRSVLKDKEWMTFDEEDMRRQQTVILQEILSKLVIASVSLKSTLEKRITEWTSTMTVMVRIYITEFSEQLHERLWIGQEELEQLHEKNLLTAKAAMKWDDFPRDKLNQLFDEIADDQLRSLKDSNNIIYEEEVRISEEAYEYAVSNFKSLMDEKLTSTTLTEQELKLIYQRMSIATLDLFLKGLELPHTTPWKLEEQHLQETLKTLEAVYIRKNKIHLKKVETARKAAIEAGKQCFTNEMIKTLPETRLSSEDFERFSKFSFDLAIQRFNEYISNNNFNENISMTWEISFKIAIDKINLDFLKENEKKDYRKPPLKQPRPPEEDPSIVTPPKVHPPIVTPPIVHPPIVTPPNATQPIVTTPIVPPSMKLHGFGIGLYIDPSKVHVGIYIDEKTQIWNSAFDHTIAIRNSKIFFGKEASSIAKENRDGTIWFDTAFELLYNYNGFSWLVNVSGRFEKLRQEEILALYFHHIRMEIQRSVIDKVLSCFVVCTAMLSSGAKQILKTSLSLAGFVKNTFISCTTAMTISFSLQSQRETNSNLFAYTCSNVIEVAVAHVTDTHVNVTNVCGDIARRPVDPKLESRLKSIFLDAPSPREYNKIVFCNASSPADQNVLRDMALNVAKNTFLFNTLFFDTITDIVRIAAMLDAVRNGNSNVPSIPFYNAVHPYEISIESKGRIKTFTDFNNKRDRKRSIKRRGDVQKLVFLEGAKASKERWNVGTYHVLFRHHNLRTKVDVLVKKEGNFFVDLNPKDTLISSSIKSITSVGRQEIFTAMKSTIKELVRSFKGEVHLIEPSSSYTSQSSTSSHEMDDDTSFEDLKENGTENTDSELGTIKSTSTSVRDTSPTSHKMDNGTSLEVLKKSLIILIEKTESELRKSKSTSTAVRDTIVVKIRKCRAMMDSSDVKIKQLEIDKIQLEQAAKLIKL